MTRAFDQWAKMMVWELEPVQHEVYEIAQMERKRAADLGYAGSGPVVLRPAVYARR
jgi:hypothetical protein